MKLLSIAVPCYNSEAYVERCLQSLLVGGDRVEIIVVNDGSKDRTQAIAEEYVKKYPDIVKLVNQENGGHGEAVNTGLKNASGLYFKVVDSDDKVDKDAMAKILDLLEEYSREDNMLDMLLANYVYDKEGVKNKKVMKYNHMIPTDRVIGWEDVKHVAKGHYILMHSVIYRTQVLRDCNLVLPKHTFYVDNIFVYNPLPYIKRFYYVDVDFYLYYIGREDQSVNEQVMIKRIDQQIKVNKIMLEQYNVFDESVITSKKLRKYMYQYLEIVTTVSTVLLLRSGTKENLLKKKDLWNYIKETDVTLYKKLRRGFIGIVMNLPGKVGRKIAVTGYRIVQKIYGFN
ncbi:MAG: glycosyltransferase [Lachnospiraceae bacterium]|nr:glycosyltransferase [Lachnospiraceae bacterium]